MLEAIASFQKKNIAQYDKLSTTNDRKTADIDINC